MLPAESIIAKIVTSVVAKLSTSLGELVLSKRRRACRYLVKLYYAIQALDDTTERILHSAASGASQSIAKATFQALMAEQDSLEFASNAFVDLSRDLQRGLELLDPALHQLCRLIYRGKADFLSVMSSGIRPNFSKSPPEFAFWMPTESLLETDFEGAYLQSAETIKRGEEYYWPSGAFEYFQDTEELVITPESDESARKLLKSLGQHHQRLKEAREQLRTLLKESFTVEELLFHQDETPA
ncbi:MAG: hypothetical protein WC426_07115 [Sulfuriferula sp.]